MHASFGMFQIGNFLAKATQFQCGPSSIANLLRINIIFFVHTVFDEVFYSTSANAKQAIYTYIESQSKLIKIPSYISSAIKKIKSVKVEYYHTYNRYPSDDEIATLTGFSIARVKHLKTLEYTIASLDSQVSEEMDGTLLDTIQDDTIVDPITNINIQERKKAIDEILNKLSPRERKILIMHFGLCGQEKHSLEEISKEMNITMERVRQIESLALNKIRGMNGSNRLRNFIKL